MAWRTHGPTKLRFFVIEQRVLWVPTSGLISNVTAFWGLVLGPLGKIVYIFCDLILTFFDFVDFPGFARNSTPSSDYGFTFWILLTLSYLRLDRVIVQVLTIVIVRDLLRVCRTLCVEIDYLEASNCPGSGKRSVPGYTSPETCSGVVGRIFSKRVAYYLLNGRVQVSAVTLKEIFIECLLAVCAHYNAN